MKNASKTARYCGFACGAVVLIGSFILLGKDEAPVIRESSKQVFLDVQKGDPCAKLSRYSVFPTSAPSVEVPGMAENFLWFFEHIFVKSYVPDVKFVSEHLKCVRAKDIKDGGPKEDVAYLRYAVGNRHVLVAQTGGAGPEVPGGKVYVFVSDIATEKSSEGRRVACWNGIFREADIVSAGTSIGVVFKKYDVFERVRGGVPASEPAGDKWFAKVERTYQPGRDLTGPSSQKAPAE